MSVCYALRELGKFAGGSVSFNAFKIISQCMVNIGPSWYSRLNLYIKHTIQKTLYIGQIFLPQTATFLYF